MADGRKNNGNQGHSTKAKGVDKRKNKYLELLDQASTPDEVVAVIKQVAKRLLVTALRLFYPGV